GDRTYTPVLMRTPSGGARFSGLNTADQNNLRANSGKTDRGFFYSISPSTPGRLLIGLTGIYESTDEGDNITDVSPTGMTGNVNTLIYGVNNTDAAYVGTSTGQLWLRKTFGTNGKNFQSVPGWNTANIPVKIVVDRQNYLIAYVLDSSG